MTDPSTPERHSVPPPPPPPRRGGGAKVMFVALVVLALAGVIVYLLSLINSKKFFLVPAGGELVVKKGVFFPMGSEVFKPNEPERAKLYEPIPVPDELRNVDSVEFPDLPSLNREFANYLIRFAKEMIFSDDEARYHRGKSYLARSGRLEGLELGQQENIRALLADVDYLEAKRAYLEVEQTLERALKMFKKAETHGTGRFDDAGQWAEKIQVLLEAIRITKASGAPPAAKSAPARPPPADAAPAPEPLVPPDPAPPRRVPAAEEGI